MLALIFESDSGAPSGDRWVLLEDFAYDVGYPGSGDRVTVPRLFVTDMASIPRPFWSVLPRWGRYSRAAVVHDWLYWEQSRSRREADRILREAMVVSGVRSWKVAVIYRAVRLGGRIAWRRNAARRASGVTRLFVPL